MMLTDGEPVSNTDSSTSMIVTVLLQIECSKIACLDGDTIHYCDYATSLSNLNMNANPVFPNDARNNAMFLNLQQLHNVNVTVVIQQHAIHVDSNF